MINALLDAARRTGATAIVRGKLIQRLLMKKTRCHVYYFYDREHYLLEIHSVWGAVRERGPVL